MGPTRSSFTLLVLLALPWAGHAALQAASTTEQRLDASDRNDDGRLALDEFTREARAAFDAVDGDRNGVVSVAELQEAAPQAEGGLSPAHRIGLIDGNDDGELALSEYEDDLEKQFEALDGNDDGYLDVGELKSGWTGRLPRP